MILYGAGGHAKVVVEALKSQSIIVSSIFDDNNKTPMFFNIPVHQEYSAKHHPELPLIIAIGNNQIRATVAKSIKHAFGIAIHQQSYVSETATVNYGTVILVNATINTEAKIGKHVIINTGAVVDHDCIIKDFCHIAPNATLCGHVEIGENCLIGANATITPCVKIGDNVTVGAGRTITKDVPSNTIITSDWV